MFITRALNHLHLHLDLKKADEVRVLDSLITFLP
jgi:hypothetical protein